MEEDYGGPPVPRLDTAWQKQLSVNRHPARRGEEHGLWVDEPGLGEVGGNRAWREVARCTGAEQDDGTGWRPRAGPDQSDPATGTFQM